MAAAAMPYLSQESQEFLLSAHPLALFMCRASLLPPSFSSFSQNFASRICVSMMSFSSAASKASYKKYHHWDKAFKRTLSVLFTKMVYLYSCRALCKLEPPLNFCGNFWICFTLKHTEFLLVTFVLVNKHFCNVFFCLWFLFKIYEKICQNSRARCIYITLGFFSCIRKGWERLDNTNVWSREQ